MFVPLYYHQVGQLGWSFIALLIVMAWMSFRSRDRVAKLVVLPSRTRQFISTIVVQSLLPVHGC
jgi:hypothetical protein